MWFAEGTFSTDGILQFLDDNKFPLITVLTELNAARVHSNTNKLQVTVVPDSFTSYHLLPKVFDISLLW